MQPQEEPTSPITEQTESDPGDWQYNEELRIVLHDTEACQLCNAYLAHFISSVMDGDESLEEARHALDTADAQALKELEDVQRRRDEAFQELAEMRLKLDIVRATLKKVREDRDMRLMNDINKDQSESIDDLSLNGNASSGTSRSE